MSNNYKKELGFIQKFTDSFALPDASVLDGGVTTNGLVGVGYTTTPNAVIHFVAPEARFDEQELASEQALRAEAMENGGKLSISSLIEHRAKLGHPEGERLEEMVKKSNAMSEAAHDEGEYVTAPEKHAKSIANMFNNVAAQYNNSIQEVASMTPVKPVIAKARGGELHVDVAELGKILENEPGFIQGLTEGATNYTIQTHVEASGNMIAEEVKKQVGQQHATTDHIRTQEAQPPAKSWADRAQESAPGSFITR